MIKYQHRGGSNIKADGDDDLDEIAIVSNADPRKVKYGSGTTLATNGPRVVPGSITSARMAGERISFGGSGSPANSPLLRTGISGARGGPPPGGGFSSSGDPNSGGWGRSVSRQSLLEVVSSKISAAAASSKKRLSRDSLTSAYINKAMLVSSSGKPGGNGGYRGGPNDSGDSASAKRRREIRARLLEDLDKTAGLGVVNPGGPGNLGSPDGKCKWTFVFDPAGRLCYYWSLVVSLAFLYNFWVLMYRFSFHEISSDSIVMWFCLDYFSDLLYVIDILFHFRTGFLEDGVLQTDSVKLRQHYMNSTTFYVDCLCLLPLDFLYLSIGFNSMLRCFRLVKIYKFWIFLDRTERHTNYPNVFRTVSLIHYLLAIFHWNACCFHIITKKSDFGNPQWPRGNTTDFVFNYLQSYYWCTIALTTVGGLPTPKTKGEYAFVVAQLLFGVMLFATVLGYVANIVTNVSAGRKEFQAKLDGVKTYMRLRRVPGHLQGKVVRWFDYLWLTHKSSDEEKAVSCLPDKLKAEIAIHVHLDTLRRVEIFQNTEAGFLCELVLRLRPVLFSPGDYICRKGEVGKEMYIVNRGRLQVVADDGKTVMATLKAGSYFGEISILNVGPAGNRRTASVRSVGYSDLFVLNKKDMWEVLKDYPAARVRLEAIAVKRLEKYKKAPLEKASMSRSHSTPGLVESRGKVSIEEMWVPSSAKPSRGGSVRLQNTRPSIISTTCMSPAHSSKSYRSRDQRSHTVDSPLSGASSSSTTGDTQQHAYHPHQPLSRSITGSTTGREPDVANSRAGDGADEFHVHHGPSRTNSLNQYHHQQHPLATARELHGGSSRRPHSGAIHHTRHGSYQRRPSVPMACPGNRQQAGGFFSSSASATSSDGTGYQRTKRRLSASATMRSPTGLLAPSSAADQQHSGRRSPFPLINPLRITPASPLPTPTSPAHVMTGGPYSLVPPSHTDFFPSPSPSDHWSPGSSTGAGGGGGGAGGSNVGGSFGGSSGELVQQQRSSSGAPQGSPRDSSSQDLLLAEIKRLRERLQVLESENSAMSMKLSQQQWEVENRLAEIEMQICGHSSDEMSDSQDEEKNQESAI